jgi:hypothetical protein
VRTAQKVAGARFKERPVILGRRATVGKPRENHGIDSVRARSGSGRRIGVILDSVGKLLE